MKRIKSIDMIRGFCIFLMVLGHTLDWWIIIPDYWLITFLFSFLAPIAATGFLFISGFSAAMAYKSRVRKAATSTDIKLTKARNIYLLRGFLLLAIGLLYNMAVAFGVGEWKWIWAWNALQAISISLLLAWPLLRTSKFIRILFGIGLLVVNDLLLAFLLPYEDQLNINGVLFHIFYHPDEAFTIIAYFAIFIIGTAVGDFLYGINIIEDPEKRRNAIKRVFLKTTSIVGITSTLFGIIYRFYDFLDRSTLSSMFYSIGAVLILLSILMYLEEFEKIKPKKSYRFFFYFSYYSFSIYIAHDVLYFVFYRKLNAINIWLAVIMTYVLITLISKYLHKKVGTKASLKSQLSNLSLLIANKIEKRKSRN